jgi:hypothetical protein
LVVAVALVAAVPKKCNGLNEIWRIKSLYFWLFCFVLEYVWCLSQMMAVLVYIEHGHEFQKA